MPITWCSIEDVLEFCSKLDSLHNLCPAMVEIAKPLILRTQHLATSVV